MKGWGFHSPGNEERSHIETTQGVSDEDSTGNKHVQGSGRSLGQTLEIKRVNNLRNEKEPPETVKSPGRVKVLKCWWQQAEQLWDLLLYLPAAQMWVEARQSACCSEAGFPGRRARNTVGTEGVEDIDRAPLKWWTPWGLVDRKGREVERRWKEGKSQGIHGQEAPQKSKYGYQGRESERLETAVQQRWRNDDVTPGEAVPGADRSSMCPSRVKWAGGKRWRRLLAGWNHPGPWQALDAKWVK